MLPTLRPRALVSGRPTNLFVSRAGTWPAVLSARALSVLGFEHCRSPPAQPLFQHQQELVIRATSCPSSRPNGFVGHQGHCRLNSSHLLFCLHSPSPQSLRFIAAPSHLSLSAPFRLTSEFRKRSWPSRHSSSSLRHSPRCFIPGRLFSRSRPLITPHHPSLGNLRLKRRRHTGL